MLLRLSHKKRLDFKIFGSKVSGASVLESSFHRKASQGDRKELIFIKKR